MLNLIVRNRTVWSFNYVYLQNIFTNNSCNLHVKKDLALDNQQWLICHETQPNQIKPGPTKD